MTYQLPELPYAYEALEPFIDADTMRLHHDKHHAAYIAKLNEALAKHPELAEKPLTELLGSLDAVPEDIRTAVRNNGGGHLNHSIFWKTLSPAGESRSPSGALLDGINEAFGSQEKFREAFTDAATKIFGSGWAWLASDGEKLEILSMPLQDNPIMQGKKPILGLDVWEHAYYLKYQNRRAEYISAWWSVVNWGEAGRIAEGADFNFS